MEKLNAFLLAMSQDALDEYLYSHSVKDIADDAQVTQDEVRAWLTSYMGV